MSNAKLSAVEDIKKLGRFLKGIADFAEELERVGSVEQSAKEAEARLAKYKMDELDATKLCNAAKDLALSEVEKANAIVAEAEAKAAIILKNAGEKSAEIVGQATTKAYGIKSESDATRAKIMVELKAFESERAVMLKEKSELEAVILNLKSELDALKKRIG